MGAEHSACGRHQPRRRASRPAPPTTEPEETVFNLPPLPVTTLPSSQPSEAGGGVFRYDTTAAKPYPPRDWLERLALYRTPDFKIIDFFMDKRTEPPPFSRYPVAASRPADARMAEGLPLPDDENPFPGPVTRPAEEITFRVVASLSTYRTRTRHEVLASLKPLFDLIIRDVDIWAAAVLADTPRAGLLRPARRQGADGHLARLRVPAGAELVRERSGQRGRPAGLGPAGQPARAAADQHRSRGRPGPASCS